MRGVWARVPDSRRDTKFLIAESPSLRRFHTKDSVYQLWRRSSGKGSLRGKRV